MANEREPNWKSDEPIGDVNDEAIAGRAEEDDEFLDVEDDDEEMDEDAEDLE